MSSKLKLTWLPGENASWEGVEMTDVAMQARFGCVEVLYSRGDTLAGFIQLNPDGSTTAYRVASSERVAVLDILRDQAYTRTSTSYDNALDEEHGFGNDREDLILEITPDLIEEITSFALIKKIPKTVKVKDFEEFMDALDTFYNLLAKK